MNDGDSQTGLLNPVDDPNKRPFGAPAFMYAFYSFVLAGGLTIVLNYVGGIPYPVEIALLFLAAGCGFESLSLIFFEPSVMLGDDIIHHRARKPSVWTTPPRMFRWSGEAVDEEIPYSSFRGVELDYTRVPFPLPVFPFTCSFFHITRWVLTMERDNGTYLLLEVGPSPDSLRAVAKKVSEFTELPLSAPWFESSLEERSDSWVWKPETQGNLDGERLKEALEKTGLSFEKHGASLEFPVEHRLGSIWRSGGLLLSVCCLLVGFLAVMTGFQYEPSTPHGLFLSIFWMLVGAGSGFVGVWLLAGYGSRVRSRIRFDREGIQVVHPVGQSSFVEYEDLIAIRGTRSNDGTSTEYGFGKPVPCLEVYGENDWFLISLHDAQKLDRFSRAFQYLT